MVASHSSRSPDPRWVVVGLYEALLGRTPAPDEGQDKVDDLLAGRSVRDVAVEMLASPECRRWHYLNPNFDAFCAPEPLAPSELRLYLWHVPRTGGTSLKQMLRGHFPDQEVCVDLRLGELFKLSNYRLRSLRFIAGHFGPTLRSMLADVDLLTATVIREPVAMVASHYAYFQNLSAPVDSASDLASRLTFDEWCRSPETGPLWSDPQSTALATPRVPPPPGAALVSEGGTRPIPPGELQAVALATLDSIDIVGTTEDLIGVYLGCLQRLGLEPTTGDAAHVNKSPEGIPPVSAETREWLLAHNQSDIALYKRAQERAASLPMA